MRTLSSSLRTTLLLATMGGCALVFGSVQAAPSLPDFSAATFVPGAPIANPYFPLLDTMTRRYRGTDDEGKTESFEHTVVGPGPVILGVQTLARRDRETKNGRIAEDTLDYYAQDSAGNVWYFGEDVTNYRYDSAGNLIGTDDASAWRAGINGALPGLAMPAMPAVGDHYYQEYAPAEEALDNGRTWAVGIIRQLAVGSFIDVVQVYESTELNSEAREFKYYARGFGLIRVEEDLSEQFEDPGLTVDFVAIGAVPEPSTYGLMAIGMLALALRRRRSLALEASHRAIAG